MSKEIAIIIATHKPYAYPDDPGYIPLHVGSALSKNKELGIIKDDVGDGMSELNPYFCELTGMNWFIKTKPAENFGLVHYRRYFRSPRKGMEFNNHRIASSRELLDLLEKYDIILPKPRNYVIEDIRVHYNNAHYKEDLDITEQVIAEHFPEYMPSFKKVFSKKSVCLYNMFVMNGERTENYGKWLFDILFQVEKKSNYKTYNSFQARVFGRLSEMLLNVWVDHNVDPAKVCYLKVVNIEGENLFKKAYYLLRRKILNEKMG